MNKEEQKVTLLAQAVVDLIDAQNRYKDGRSDEMWSDVEMAERKTKAREMGLRLVREYAPYLLSGRQI